MTHDHSHDVIPLFYPFARHSTHVHDHSTMRFLRATVPRAWISRTRADAYVPRHAIANITITRSTANASSNANTKPTTSAEDGNRDPRPSQGHVTDPAQQHPQDPLSQTARSGLDTRHSGSSSKLEGTKEGEGNARDSPLLDAASPTESGMKAPKSELSGNKEGIGFVEQVGSVSGTSRSMRGRKQGEEEAKEEATSPGILSALKQVLGMGSSVEDVKQNRGGGEGVTGTGTGIGLGTGTKRETTKTGEGTIPRTPGSRKSYYSCATLGSVDPVISSATVSGSSSTAPEKESQSQYPNPSRKPKERTHGDQNEHLVHKRSSQDHDSGSGNAAEEPFLPSHRDAHGTDGGGSKQG
ncbi:hypothetical protein EDC04DRAFT_1030451 [Pisolithus marmoratus]|nr:hypothetical protein EDC04DRAFT_1030451 [Pisolithus marmoratus]